MKGSFSSIALPLSLDRPYPNRPPPPPQALNFGERCAGRGQPLMHPSYRVLRSPTVEKGFSMILRWLVFGFLRVPSGSFGFLRVPSGSFGFLG